MAKPTLPSGFLGGQPKLGDIKMKTDSHKDPEFRVIAENNVVIKFKTGLSTKVVTKLTQCASEKELPEYVFVQRKDYDSVYFNVGFPSNGFYQFMIFALPESDTTESLPNVYNYLISVERITKPHPCFVKAYTLFYKDCCYLHEPLFLNANTLYLDHTKFEVEVKNAKKVAIHANNEWKQLEKKGHKWEGKVDLLKCKEGNSKVTLNASYDEKSTSYSVLLEYEII